MMMIITTRDSYLCKTLVECAHVTNDADQVDSLEDDDGHAQNPE